MRSSPRLIPNFPPPRDEGLVSALSAAPAPLGTCLFLRDAAAAGAGGGAAPRAPAPPPGEPRPPRPLSRGRAPGGRNCPGPRSRPPPRRPAQSRAGPEGRDARKGARSAAAGGGGTATVQKAAHFQHAQGCEAAREGLTGRLGGNADRMWSQNPEARLFQTGALPSGRGRQAGAQRLGGRRDRREARVYVEYINMWRILMHVCGG